jgi:catechol 2,3-dioxygenase-like lactoylglutathione lyase family enzyme
MNANVKGVFMRAHLSINVSNVSESVEFYKKVFGVNPQKQTADYAKFDLKDPSLNFSMQTAS